MASSQPPPSATPLTQAMTGLRQSSIWRKTCWPRWSETAPVGLGVGVDEAAELASAPGGEGVFA